MTEGEIEKRPSARQPLRVRTDRSIVTSESAALPTLDGLIGGRLFETGSIVNDALKSAHNLKIAE